MSGFWYNREQVSFVAWGFSFTLIIHTQERDKSVSHNSAAAELARARQLAKEKIWEENQLEIVDIFGRQL